MHHRLVSLALLVALVALGTMPAAAQTTRVAVTGTFFTQVFTGPNCASPVNFCSFGTVEGDLTGTVDVALQTAEFTDFVDGNPTKFVYSTDITITNPEGTLTGISNGTIDLFTSALTATFTLNSGTGAFEGTTGVLTVNGTSNPATGEEILPFTGFLDVPVQQEPPYVQINNGTLSATVTERPHVTVQLGNRTQETIANVGVVCGWNGLVDGFGTPNGHNFGTASYVPASDTAGTAFAGYNVYVWPNAVTLPVGQNYNLSFQIRFAASPDFTGYAGDVICWLTDGAGINSRVLATSPVVSATVR